MAALGASSAHASLILVPGPENFQGTGLGAVNTILTIQSPGSTTIESGAVTPGANGEGTVTSGDTIAINQVRTLGELGVSSADSLRVVFNAQEPGNAAENNILLQDLVLNIYDSSGSLLFTSGAFDPVFCPDTATGVGNSGYSFRLDAEQTLQAQAAAFGEGFASNLVGLSATAGVEAGGPGSATGGPETFFVAQAPGQVPPDGQVPIPGTVALLGLGVLGLGLKRKRAS